MDRRKEEKRRNKKYFAKKVSLSLLVHSHANYSMMHKLNKLKLSSKNLRSIASEVRREARAKIPSQTI